MDRRSERHVIALEAKLSYRAPLYVIAAPLGDAAMDMQAPFVVEGPITGTFDEDLRPALAGIWYAMHLPKTAFETLDLPLRATWGQATGRSRPHSIALIPDSLLKNGGLLKELVAPYESALIICTADRLNEAADASRSLGFILDPIHFEELGQELLDHHWKELARHWADLPPTPFPRDDSAPRWSWPIGLAGSELQLKRLRRMMGASPLGPPNDESPIGIAAEMRETRLRLAALVELEDEEGMTRQRALEELPRVMREKALSTRERLTLSLPGTSPRYKRLAESTLVDSATEFVDSYPEVRALLVAHAASGDDSIGISIKQAIPSQSFQILADLERHWTERPRPSAVRKFLRRLNSSMESLWDESLVRILKSAYSMEVFTDFPIGLLTLPGDTSPLSARVPISYRSTNPLTRALQFELSPHAHHDLSDGCRVLVAECIPESDIVGRLSRRSWALVEEEMDQIAAGIDVTIEETLSPAEVRRAIREHQPDVLVLSAHGFSMPDANVAGLMIGDRQSLGDDLGPMPPLVILSACHTSPRGGGVVNVSDLLIREGAYAVLSTLVPVDVRHNAQLVARFFRYLGLAIGDREPGGDLSVLDVWHRTQSANVVVDLSYGNRNLQDWFFQNADRPSPVDEFMSGKGLGDLRGPHLYDDAEARVIEIASRRGDDVARIANWLRSPGYLPESLMYTMLGKPQSIIVATE